MTSLTLQKKTFKNRPIYTALLGNLTLPKTPGVVLYLVVTSFFEVVTSCKMIAETVFYQDCGQIADQTHQ